MAGLPQDHEDHAEDRTEEEHHAHRQADVVEDIRRDSVRIADLIPHEEEHLPSQDSADCHHGQTCQQAGRVVRRPKTLGNQAPLADENHPIAAVGTARCTDGYGRELEAHDNGEAKEQEQEHLARDVFVVHGSAPCSDTCAQRQSQEQQGRETPGEDADTVMVHFTLPLLASQQQISARSANSFGLTIAVKRGPVSPELITILRLRYGYNPQRRLL